MARRTVVIMTPKPGRKKKPPPKRSLITLLNMYGSPAATKVKRGTPRRLTNTTDAINMAHAWAIPKYRLENRLFKWENRQQVRRKSTTVVKTRRRQKGFQMPRTKAVGKAHKR